MLALGHGLRIVSDALTLPDLDPRVSWSIRVLDAANRAVLLEHEPGTVLETASIGKVFLLIDVARRIETGALDPALRVRAPRELAVADSGVLYRMRDQAQCVEDLALLVGAFSDNLATNALLHVCGLESVRDVAPSLGYTRTSLLDYIRDERTAEMPWTPSYGAADELADLMLRLGAGEIHSPTASARVLDWLGANADTELVADPLRLDPLAHVEPDARGVLLRHKTGSTSTVRADAGIVSGRSATLAYAVLANWTDTAIGIRESVTRCMRAIGAQIGARATADG